MNQMNQENQLHTVCFSQIHNTYIFRISLINIISTVLNSRELCSCQTIDPISKWGHLLCSGLDIENLNHDVSYISIQHLSLSKTEAQNKLMPNRHLSYHEMKIQTLHQQ